MKNTLTSMILAGAVVLSGASVGCKRDKSTKVRSNLPQTSQSQAYTSKYGVSAGPLALENTNVTINASHITRKDLTYLVETNKYAKTNELNWVLRPANAVNLHPYSEVSGAKTFRADGLYLIPTLKTNANGSPVEGFTLANSQFSVDYVKEQKLKDQFYGDKINVRIEDPLVKVPVLGTNYYTPDAVDGNGNMSVRVIQAKDDQRFDKYGRRFLPGPVYELNLVSQNDYLLRSLYFNAPKTNALVQPKPVNFGSGQDSD